MKRYSTWVAILLTVGTIGAMLEYTTFTIPFVIGFTLLIIIYPASLLLNND